MSKNGLGLTDKQLLKVFKTIESYDSPKSFRMNSEMAKLVGQFESLIEMMGNQITIIRDDGIKVVFTRRATKATDSRKASKVERTPDPAKASPPTSMGAE